MGRGGRHRPARGRRLLGPASCIAAVACLAVVVSIVASTRPGRSPQQAHVPAARQTEVSAAAESDLDRSIGAYSWADATGSPFHKGGAAVVLVQKLSPRRALAALVPHADESLRSARDVRSWARRTSTVSITCATVEAFRDGPWTVLVELGNVAASTPQSLRRLSRFGTVVSVRENAQLDAALVVARAGRMVRQVDPVLGTSEVGAPLDAERGVEFGVRTSLTAMARSLVVIARLTGLQLSRADLVGRPAAVAVGYCA